MPRPIIWKVPRLNDARSGLPLMQSSPLPPPPFEGGAERTALFTILGGGNTVITATKAAFLNAIVSGGGSVVLSNIKKAFLALVTTGGGSVLLSVKKGALVALSVTGGGAVTLSRVASHLISIVVSGGGSVLVAGYKNAKAIVFRSVQPLGPSEVDDPLTYEEIFGDTPPKTYNVPPRDFDA